MDKALVADALKECAELNILSFIFMHYLPIAKINFKKQKKSIS